VNHKRRNQRESNVFCPLFAFRAYRTPVDHAVLDNSARLACLLVLCANRRLGRGLKLGKGSPLRDIPGEDGQPTLGVARSTSGKLGACPLGAVRSTRWEEITEAIMAETNIAPPTEAVSPSGINHLVLNVRDIEESHKFWTEIVGFKQVGELHPRADRPLPPKMRFYSALNDGQLTHHTVALVESANLPPPADWVLANSSVAINHVALTMPNREAWLTQLAFLQSKGIKFNWRVNHGVTHSVYINDPNGYGVEFLYELPREMWENDIDAGINWLENLPTEGPEALVDRTDTPSFGRKEPAPVPAE
jgi:catechol 2,3-dioxygenase